MRANITRCLWVVGVSCTLGGCPIVKPTVPPARVAELGDVLNQLKDELNAYHQIDQKAALLPAAMCTTSTQPMTLTASHAVVTLKTVATEATDKNGKLVSPVMGILKLEPSLDYATTTGRTQTVTVAFNVGESYGPPVEHADDAARYPLAHALAGIKEQIMRIDHGKSPCLVFGSKDKKDDKAPIQLTVQFEAVRDTTTGAKFQLVVLKLSDQAKVTSDAVQTMTIDLVSSQPNAIHTQIQ